MNEEIDKLLLIEIARLVAIVLDHELLDEIARLLALEQHLEYGVKELLQLLVADLPIAVLVEHVEEVVEEGLAHVQVLVMAAAARSEAERFDELAVADASVAVLVASSEEEADKLFGVGRGRTELDELPSEFFTTGKAVRKYIL